MASRIEHRVGGQTRYQRLGSGRNLWFGSRKSCHSSIPFLKKIFHYLYPAPMRFFFGYQVERLVVPY